MPCLLSRRSAADLAADRIFLLIERAPFGTGDVTAVLARHEALFVADRVILGMNRTRLAAGDLSFATLLIDAVVLIFEAGIHLGAPWMSLIPGLGIRELRGAGQDADRQDCESNA
jgi:hypothetical protein